MPITRYNVIDDTQSEDNTGLEPRGLCRVKANPPFALAQVRGSKSLLTCGFLLQPCAWILAFSRLFSDSRGLGAASATDPSSIPPTGRLPATAFNPNDI